jgi:hypothetical protein
MPPRIDLTGQRFGRLIVCKSAPKRGRHTYWSCVCDCGAEKVTRTEHLRTGRTVGCGCVHPGLKHGHCRMSVGGKHRRTHEYQLWFRARLRAAERNIPFNIEISDIVIPATCPVLGVPLWINRDKHGATPNSPTLDRLIPRLGYVKGNVCVISHRANVIKSDASAAELRRVASWLEKELSLGVGAGYALAKAR